MYIATVAAEVIESADSLPELLAVLAELHSPDVLEDVAVWQGFRLVCVRHPSGVLTIPAPRLAPLCA